MEDATLGSGDLYWREAANPQPHCSDWHDRPSRVSCRCRGHVALDSTAPQSRTEAESEFRSRATTESVASRAVSQIEATHREISTKRIRELENLAQRIADSQKCECRELDRVMERFELLRSALLPWLIREQYLLLPAVKQRISAEKAGAAYTESYQGEFDDLVRTAEADHNHLHMLANDLDREVLSLANKGFCSQKVKSFAEVLEKLVSCMSAQFQLEESVLFPCFEHNAPK